MIIRRCSISNSTSQRSQSQKMSENEQCSSNSHFSTCCSNTSSEIDEIDDPLNYASFNDFQTVLPLVINGVKIQKVTWDLFSAPPNLIVLDSWLYLRLYDEENEAQQQYQVQIECKCMVLFKQQIMGKNKWDRLLEHETGHYLIGCLCALEFKARAEKTKFTKNYRLESMRIFQDTFQEYLSLERRYDEETNHSQNISRQKEWNEFIIKELQKY